MTIFILVSADIPAGLCHHWLGNSKDISEMICKKTAACITKVLCCGTWNTQQNSAVETKLTVVFSH